VAPGHTGGEYSTFTRLINVLIHNHSSRLRIYIFYTYINMLT
jgi:hypothetical protein